MAPIEAEFRGIPMPLRIENFEEGETVHQRCIIVRGTYTAANATEEGLVTVHTNDSSGNATFPTQTWPIVDGRIKLLVLLSPGANKLTIRREHCAEKIDHEININYNPLLQSPPLHLAIMIAKDSPLLIDCPPTKYGDFSSTHSTLDAAISKFRMTAYMWQALTAEDMWTKSLGRRSFRLEEEWTTDTTSQQFLDGVNESALFESGAMRSTAKIHLIKSDKTVAEIRNAKFAQQNRSAKSKNKLFDFFLDALKAHGSPFETSAHPIIAGLILDSHYSVAQNLIVGHAALGCHNPNGVSLGMFGSHLTYAWPRFVEEVSSCLLDARTPGDTVGNDNGECGSLWEACSVGQGAFLHEVGHAFGAAHTTGIMERGYAQHWPRNFVVQTAYSSHTDQEGFVVVDGETDNKARWDLQDALSFKLFPHFWLPGDEPFTADVRSALPSVQVVDREEERSELQISSPAGIAHIQFNGSAEASPSVMEPDCKVTYTSKDLEERFPQTEPLHLTVLGMNGKQKTIRNAWRLFGFARTSIRIPGSNVILKKQSVTSEDLEDGNEPEDETEYWTWATLLTHRNGDGTITKATKVDVRTGCVLDGAYVYFGDDVRLNCGPRTTRYGDAYRFGGHLAEAIDIPADQEIVKVEVGRTSFILSGLRMHLGNGEAKGALSGSASVRDTCVLEAPVGEQIVGFYGRSYWGRNFDGVVEFGILTAAKDLELPEIVYSMAELQNTDGGIS